MKRSIFPVLAAALAFAAAAPVGAQRAFRTDDDDAHLIVQNNRSVPVTVYLEHSPFERELGTVEPMQTATFEVPPHLARVGEMAQLLIQPRGQIALRGRAFGTGENMPLGLVIPATPGQERRARNAMTAWQRSGEPIVARTAVDIDEYEPN